MRGVHNIAVRSDSDAHGDGRDLRLKSVEHSREAQLQDRRSWCVSPWGCHEMRASKKQCFGLCLSPVIMTMFVFGHFMSNGSDSERLHL